MLVTAAIFFCGGLCFQAFCPVPFGSIGWPALALLLIIIVPFARKPLLALLLIVFCFFFVGAARLALVPSDVMPPVEENEVLFKGSVVESSRNSKTVKLTDPEYLKGYRVAYMCSDSIEVSQEISIAGRLRPLIPAFKNPGALSQQWIRRLEGVNYEIKGKLVSVTEGRNWVGGIRRYFKENIERSDARHKDILKALTIGDRSSVSQGENNLFMRTGTSHILAISGFNVGIVSGFFFFFARLAIRRSRICRLSGRDTRYAALATIPFPFLFMLVAGAGVSVVRATLMTVVFMIALFLEREKHFYATTALAALTILLIYPHSLFSPSFQLTFASLIAIALSGQRLSRLLFLVKSKATRWTASTVAATIAATLGTAPIVIYYFYGMNPFCLFHNVVTIPLLGVGATTSALVGMTHPAGSFLLDLAGVITDVNLRLLRLLDHGYLFPLIRPSVTEIGLYYAMLMSTLFAFRKPVNMLVLALLIPLSAIQLFADYRLRYNKELRIHFIDVGMGDATLIEVPGGMRILIDAGGFPGSDFDTGKNVITPFLLSRKIRHLDYVINTHPHADHIGGLPYVLSHFDTSNLVTSGLFPGEPAFFEMTNTAKSLGVKRVIWKRGDGILSGTFRLTALHPAAGMPLVENINNASLVLRLIHGKHTFLLPGDILSDVEDQLVLSEPDLRSDVLKLAHHGSNYSSSPAFLFAVKPRAVVLSVGRGEKNLPGQATMERVKNMGLPVLRTDKHGLVELWSDGGEIRWKTVERR
jgi:competence protein ComEC